MNPAHFPKDPLFELERKIARRADELARQRGSDREQALADWRDAEREVWENYATAPHPHETALAPGR